MLSSQFQVFDINGTALLVKLGTLPRLPDLKINTGQELFLMLLTAGTCGKRPGLRNPSTIWDKGYFYLLFIHTGPVTGQELFLMLLTAGTCGKRPGLRNPSTIWDKGYFYLLFIHTGPVTGQELFLMLLTAGTCGKRPGLRNPSTIWDKGYCYLLFILTGPVANLEKHLFCMLQLLWAVVCLPWFASCDV